MILIVSYDLQSVNTRAAFFQALQQQGEWWHYLTSTWLISTDKTPEQVFNVLSPFMTTSDRLLIFELGRSYFGFLPKEAWDWIQARSNRNWLTEMANQRQANPLLPKPSIHPLAGPPSKK
jgi:hypothetical protein